MHAKRQGRLLAALSTGGTSQSFPSLWERRNVIFLWSSNPCFLGEARHLEEIIKLLFYAKEAIELEENNSTTSEKDVWPVIFLL